MSTEKNILEIIELMRRDDSVDAPVDAVRWATNIFRQRASEPKKSFVQKLVAVLQMEIAPGTPALGERSTTTSQVRQMLFRAGDNAIDLRIEQQQKGSGIRGQILGEGYKNAVVKLFNDQTSIQAKTDDLSEFAIDHIPDGEFELVIYGEGFEISLKAIEIP
jgi:hypothetical protein